jgi:hypothetical protein
VVGYQTSLGHQPARCYRRERSLNYLFLNDHSTRIEKVLTNISYKVVMGKALRF